MRRRRGYKRNSNASAARAVKRQKTTFGKPFRKKSSKGKFKKGTMIRYKYVNGRRVGAEKSRK